MFQKSVLNKYLESLEKDKVENAYQAFKKNYTPVKIKEIKMLKEEEYQDGFLRDLFVDALGYIIKPEDNYNLVREFKNQSDGKKADGAILKDAKAIAVIELKSTKTKDLKSITQQAFNYKNNQPECKYVITSNFQKLRFYIDYANEYEEFDLFQLTKEAFEFLYLILSKDSIFDDIPQKLKKESIFHEEKVSKQLYEDYSIFKNRLFQNLINNNPEYDKLTLFKKSQKLIDRFLFILFAEDRGLLPPNSIDRIIQRFSTLKEEDAYKPLYDIYKQYFGYMNIGRKGKKLTSDNIPAYNGGLFYPDTALDSLKIDDDVLIQDLQKLSVYDFNTEIDVNILGHIFEHSLSEIEEITAEIEGATTDKTKSKRKKDGVFYTPKYITQYIVESTIGRLCEEKRRELDIFELELDESYHIKHGKKSKKGKILYQKLEAYQAWLLSLKIVDPACGSGAFLNQALSFLINEHNMIIELQTDLEKGQIALFNIETAVLENNLYGVDINEESVEIAKLSLWLRTAQRGRKLSILSNNIKCGNSLIDDPEIAGHKAFNWKMEFPDVFSKGGFDVVIGNPPYVGEKGHSEIFENLKKISKWKKFYRRRSNTYYFFINHGINILSNNGIQSLIVPREFINADWANKVRKGIIEDSKILEIVDFNKFKVFEDAGTTSLILTHKKKKESDYVFSLKSIKNISVLKENLFGGLDSVTVKVKKLISDNYKPWNLNPFEIKYSEKIIPLGELFSVSQGLITGADKVTKKHIKSLLINEEFSGRGIFILSLGKDIIFKNNEILLNIENNWIQLTDDDKEFIKPYYKAENLKKWIVSSTSLFILHVGNRELTNNIKDYLLQFDKILLNRATINGDKIINLSEFENFTNNDIKLNYSSAGAVQKIMKRKKWFLPFYERMNVPFESCKIVVNTKNMNVFTFSDSSLYSSGGGAGGQNFIYLKENCEILTKNIEITTIKEFVIYINALLNSSLLQFYIKISQFNQLSTSKISNLPICLLDLRKKEEFGKYTKILSYCQTTIINSNKLNTLSKNFLHYIESSILNMDLLKFQNWHELEFREFINELNQITKKAGREKLSKAEEMEWMELFESKKVECQKIKSEIYKTDKEIDQVVYGLYELTEDEIKIIEAD